jgi:hypothetical protein
MMDKEQVLLNLRDTLHNAIDKHLITNSASSQFDTIGELIRLIELSEKAQLAKINKYAAVARMAPNLTIVGFLVGFLVWIIF